VVVIAKSTTRSQSQATRQRDSVLHRLESAIQGNTFCGGMSLKHSSCCGCRIEASMPSNTSRSSKFAARYSSTDRRCQRVRLATVTALPSFLNSTEPSHHHGTTLRCQVNSQTSQAPRTCVIKRSPTTDQPLPACWFCRSPVHRSHSVNRSK
jgi:hypothetical protein